MAKRLSCARRGASSQHWGSPRPVPGALAHTANSRLPADLDGGSTGAGAARAGTFTVGDNLDPQRVLAFVVGRGAGLPQRIQAVLRRARGRGGESRQLEDHPRAAIQFAELQRHGRPFGGHLDLGAGAYVGRTGQGELLAIAADNDGRQRRSAATCRWGRISAWASTGSWVGPASWASTGGCGHGRTCASAGTGSCDGSRGCGCGSTWATGAIKTTRSEHHAPAPAAL